MVICIAITDKGVWKIISPDSHTGLGRLQSVGRRGSTVVRGSMASMLLALLRPSELMSCFGYVRFITGVTAQIKRN